MPEIQTIVLSVDSALDRMPERRLFPSDLGFAVGAEVITGRGVGVTLTCVILPPLEYGESSSWKSALLMCVILPPLE